MLQALQDRERFDLVREWIDVYGYPSQLREVGVFLTAYAIKFTFLHSTLD